MFKWDSNLSESERIKKNVLNLLNIRKNEVCFDRDMGVSADYIDKTENKITSLMLTEIQEMLSEKEPRAAVSVGNLITFNENGEYSFKAVISSV
ncbi:hypothetical protein [Anaerocolumna chitinilytica]|uniref:Uncharacterized protein n=1 Tax=Anaerocolumna chitinilytica TaxID=1727145 RepID=A0A7I8DI68_9FIRM|nr:hypothetical protein [Anaerocolumna chitinilytica]BCJ98119.1 hypothetical protein bsdcttw_11600 [Anaerocolumna chitinilytica]